MREKLGSRLGFILLSAGCAIGIGNVWKFPYMVGENGGAIFVLIYLFFLLVMGVPVLTMEFSLGRAAQKSPVKMYQQLEKPGHKWHLHGLFAMFGNYILMMFYTSISGLMLAYFFSTVTGKFNGLTPEQISTYYDTTTGNLPIMLIVTFAAIIIGFVVFHIILRDPGF